MAISMYMGQPLHGEKPSLAIDLYDSSLQNLAPSYLTAKLNEKVMNDLTDKSGTTTVSNGGNTITTIFDDGTKETLIISEDGTSCENCVYNKQGLLLKKTVTSINEDTGVLRNNVTYDGSVDGVVSFADASWEEIKIMLTRHYSGDINLANFWSVGDVKRISYDTMAATGVSETHSANNQKIVILGFDHDTIAGGTKSAVTIGFLNGLGNPGYINPNNSNIGGWNSSNRRAWCNNTFYMSLPRTLRSIIKTVSKTYTPGNASGRLMNANDKCFLLSESEILGENTVSSYMGEGEQYPFFVGNGYAIRKKQSDLVSGYDNWLTRSTSKEGTKHFVYIESDGDSNVCDANSLYQIIPAFCI